MDARIQRFFDALVRFASQRRVQQPAPSSVRAHRQRAVWATQRPRNVRVVDNQTRFFRAIVGRPSKEAAVVTKACDKASES